MPRTEEQNKEIRTEKREKILHTAMELFAIDGFHTTSISKIAKKVGISKGLIYNYFESKNDLLKAIIYEGMESTFALFDPNNDGFLTEEEFDYFIDGTFEMLEKNHKFWKLYFALATQPFAAELLSDVYQNIIESYIKILIDYYARHNSEDPEGDALLFGATLDGVSFNYVTNPDLFPIEKLKKMIKTKYKYPTIIKKK